MLTILPICSSCSPSHCNSLYHLIKDWNLLLNKCFWNEFGQDKDYGRSVFFFFLWFLWMIRLCDDIWCGELFTALSSTLGQFPPVGIFDWENGGWFVNDSPRAAGLRQAQGGTLASKPPPPLAPGREGPAMAARPSGLQKKVLACPPLSALPVEVRCDAGAVPQRESDGWGTFWAASLPSARASVSRGCLGNLSVDLPGAECKSSLEEMHKGLSACQLCVCVCSCVCACVCVCVTQQSFL